MWQGPFLPMLTTGWPESFLGEMGASRCSSASGRFRALSPAPRGLWPCPAEAPDGFRVPDPTAGRQAASYPVRFRAALPEKGFH